MPSCREMSELATDYMEDALPWRARLGAWRHLRLCAMCRAYYDQLAKVQRLLHAGALAGPEPETEDRLLAKRAPEGGTPQS